MKRAGGTTMNWLFESWGNGFVHGVQFNIKKGFLFCGSVHTDILLTLILQTPVIIYKHAANRSKQ
jgi:hypothetical protein